MPALIAVLLSASIDRPAWLAAILGDRYRASPTLMIGMVVGHLALIGIAGAGAAAIAGTLTPNARTLFAGLALIAAATGAAWPPRAPSDRLDGWRVGPLVTGGAGIFILGLGERTQFLAAGLAILSPSPALSAGGAGIGSIVPCIAAAALGEKAWRRLPLRAASVCAALLLGVAGFSLALSGLRIV